MELLKVTWLVQTMQGLVATKVARVCVRWGGQEDGMSSDHRDLQLHSPRTRGWGDACCILLLVCRTEGWSSVNQLRSGGLDGWCVTMKGVLLVF